MCASNVFDIYLASASPRRCALLQQLGVRFRQLSVDVPEVVQDRETPEDFVIRLALEKARAGLATSDDKHPVLGADTAVVIDGDILGKPADRAAGLAILARLSGCTHQVLSGVALIGATVETRLCTSQVSFRELTAEECRRYWETGEPLDKAGAYAVQGRAARFICNLQGSYSGVMGLPLFETAELLEAAGIDLLVLP